MKRGEEKEMERKEKEEHLLLSRLSVRDRLSIRILSYTVYGIYCIYIYSFFLFGYYIPRMETEELIPNSVSLSCVSHFFVASLQRLKT